MEDILEVYARPVDPRRPLICLDEGGKELRAHALPAIAARPGQPAREDYTYRRGGAANLFLAVAPHLGWRTVRPTTQRTRFDFAHFVRSLLETCFPDADQIVLVTDNLNTHTTDALYDTFPPDVARRLVERIEWHYTPVHGSWLNMAELELSVLARQCLKRRIPDRETLNRDVTAWVTARNALRTRLRWSFSIDEARDTLHHIYPVPQQDN